MFNVFLFISYLLTESQPGFKSMFSTETALLEVAKQTPQWCNISLFEKAFDTMDHAILLEKL